MPRAPATVGLRSINEVHVATGIDPGTIRHHLEQRHWPGVRVGKGRGAWRLPPGVVEYLLAGRDPAELKQALDARLAVAG